MLLAAIAVASAGEPDAGDAPAALPAAPAELPPAPPPLPLPEWDQPPPKGAYGVGVAWNRSIWWSLAAGAGTASLGVGLMALDSGASWSVGNVLLISSAAPAALATPGLAVAPLVSCVALRHAGRDVSCSSGVVAVTILGVASAATVFAITEPDLEGLPAVGAALAVPGIWIASAIQVHVNRRELRLYLAQTGRQRLER